MNSKSYWYNFDTAQYDYRDMPQTIDEALPYISDFPGARGLFRLNVEFKKMSIPEALIDVYSKMLPEQKSPATNKS